MRTACLLKQVSTQVFRDDAICKAKDSIKKRGCFESRPPMYIRRQTLVVILRWIARNAADKRFGTLFLIAYCFLLRLPSEALPIQAGRGCAGAALYLHGDELVLCLRRRYSAVCSAVCCAYAMVPRKNKPAGSKLLRKCWCIAGDAESLETCPVHVVGKLLESVADGTFLFEGITAADARSVAKDTARSARRRSRNLQDA